MWLVTRGIEKLWMFFLQSVGVWLVPTWYNSLCPGTKWLPWLIKIRIGMLWCNAGRGLSPCWLMATKTEQDPWLCVCFTCGWDAVSSKPGNNCGLNLDATSRVKKTGLSLVLSQQPICLLLAGSHLSQEKFYISIHVYAFSGLFPSHSSPLFSSYSVYLHLIPLWLMPHMLLVVLSKDT